MTIRFRIIAGYAALVTVTIIALLAALRLLVEQTIIRQLVLNHEVEAAEFAIMADRSSRDETESRWRQHTDLDAGLYKFFLIGSDGRELHRSVALKEVASSFLLATPDGRADLGGELGECLITTHAVERHRVRVITPLEVPMSIVYRFYEIGAVVLVLGVALSLVCGALYAGWVLRPLVRMAEAARAIGTTGPGARIPVEDSAADDEAGRLALLLNAGYDRIDASIERLRRFSAEVSHELRTPLSIVRLNAERVRDLPDAPREAREMAVEQLGEIERLNRFIGNLLGFAKLDAGGVRMERREVRVGEWLADFAEDAVLLAEEVGCRFELSRAPSGVARFDPVWMRQVLLNLLSNALRVTPRGGLVRVGAEITVHGVLLWMDDEGSGLPPDRLEAIFERYVRFGEERGPAEGVGLGLAISRSVVELHGGEIHAENRTDRSGLRVIVRLPSDHAH